MKNQSTIKTQYIELKGTAYEIGQQMASFLPFESRIVSPQYALSKTQLDESLALYEEHCPGLKEELIGYADGYSLELNQLIYCTMTYLRPNCSQMVLMPTKTENGHVILARSYEFAPQFEDFKVYKVSPEGKYAHISGSIADFGRSEGLNEHGLGITMTSCGSPVSNQKEMRPPAFKGLQFWAVVRSLLENCKDVDEALKWVKKMPLAYNINLLIADSSGQAVLYETLNGASSYSEIKQKNHSDRSYLHATNHPVLEPFVLQEPIAMQNSIIRYQKMSEFLEHKSKISLGELKTFLLKDYPNGLNCHHFSEFFGTIKSVVLDLNDLSFQICWGGEAANGWDSYDFNSDRSNESFEHISKAIEIRNTSSEKGFFDPVSLV